MKDHKTTAFVQLHGLDLCVIQKIIIQATMSVADTNSQNLAVKMKN